MGISVKMGVLGPGQRFKHTFCLQRRRLQTYQTHIDPTIHVGYKLQQIIDKVSSCTLTYCTDTVMYLHVGNVNSIRMLIKIFTLH